MKVTKVRYFKTNKGVGYQCKTNIKDIEICNDGTGGATYVEGAFQNIKLLKEYTESELEDLIDEYESLCLTGMS
jgi:hypothetical protein